MNAPFVTACIHNDVTSSLFIWDKYLFPLSSTPDQQMMRFWQEEFVLLPRTLEVACLFHQTIVYRFLLRKRKLWIHLIPFSCKHYSSLTIQDLLSGNFQHLQYKDGSFNLFTRQMDVTYCTCSPGEGWDWWNSPGSPAQRRRRSAAPSSWACRPWSSSLFNTHRKSFRGL